ncbi:MAG: Rap1a/Tai family immunity protein [Pseudomonadota bacterium]|nr:Rap1a/Tai family immunity protein [Pseudomonadota bacterium]
MRYRNLIISAVAMAAVASMPRVGATELSGYTVRQLLEPCIEGDNDARWGAAAEGECEQYITGFVDAFLLLTKDPKAAGVCLPPAGNRPDEVRWAFMKWAAENRDKRDEPAVVGLLATVKEKFPCK